MRYAYTPTKRAPSITRPPVLLFRQGIEGSRVLGVTQQSDPAVLDCSFAGAAHEFTSPCPNFHLHAVLTLRNALGTRRNKETCHSGDDRNSRYQPEGSLRYCSASRSTSLLPHVPSEMSTPEHAGCFVAQRRTRSKRRREYLFSPVFGKQVGRNVFSCRRGGTQHSGQLRVRYGDLAYLYWLRFGNFIGGDSGSGTSPQ
jgi:hypothetical protein